MLVVHRDDRPSATSTSARRSPVLVDHRAAPDHQRRTVAAGGPIPGAQARTPPSDRSLAEQQEEHGHPDGHAVAHLLGDEGAGSSATSEAISTPRTIGPGWRITRPGWSMAARPGGEAVAGRVLAEGGDELPAPPLGLHPEQRDHVGLGQHVVEVVADGGDRPPVQRGWQQGGRCHQGDLGAHGRVGRHLGPGHPAVADVAHDGHLQPLEPGQPGRRHRPRAWLTV